MQVAEPELSVLNTYALKHYWDFVGFSVDLHVYMETFQYSDVLKLRFSLPSEFVITLLGKHLYVYECPLLAFLFLRDIFQLAMPKIEIFFVHGFGVIVNSSPFSLFLVFHQVRMTELSFCPVSLILSFPQ